LLTVFPNAATLLSLLKQNYQENTTPGNRPEPKEEKSMKPRVCAAVGCERLSHSGLSICCEHNFMYEEIRNLCSIKESNPEEDDFCDSNINKFVKKAFEKIRIQLDKDPTTGVYIGITTNMSQRLTKHKPKNFQRSEELVNLNNMRQAASVEYFAIAKLSGEIDNRRIYNGCAGGSFPAHKANDPGILYALYFDKYLKPDMEETNKKLKNKFYLSRSLKTCHRKASYEECKIPKIKSKLSRASVTGTQIWTQIWKTR
jgi:hypothetical protein